MKYYLAIDIGASSGRHIIGHFENNELVMNEIYRFKNEFSNVNNHLIWNIDYLVTEIKKGIKKTLELYPHIESMSIDTWGVDYVLMNGDKEIYPVYAYRDQRTKEAIEEVHQIIPFDEIYSITGSQFQEFNTIYQLYKDKLDGRLDNADNYLMMPEYLIYKLTNKKIHEYTNASTTSLLDLKTNDFSNTIIDKLDLPKHLFTTLVKPGTFVGNFTKEVEEECLGNIKVYTCATHDTGSAVEAIINGLSLKENDIYLSSGTWSLLGVCLYKGINNSDARLANYSNEYGPNYIRFQKNIMGLWITQSLKKQCNEISFEEMIELAKKSTFDNIFDVNDEMFLSSQDMKQSIKDWYIKHNMEYPKCDEDYFYATYNSLAYSYKQAILELEKITNKKYQRLIIVGGGAKNELLNSLTMKHCGIEVIAKPIEATAMGNIYSQIKK